MVDIYCALTLNVVCFSLNIRVLNLGMSHLGG